MISPMACKDTASFMKGIEKTTMLSRLMAVSASVVLSFGPTLTALANPAGDARTAITSAYTRMDKVLVHKDASAYTAYLHPEFFGAYPQGKEIHGKDAEAASLRQIFSLAKTVASSTQIMSCALQDGGAVITTRETFSLSGTNEKGPFVIKSVDMMRSFWVKASGHWLKKRERSISDTATVNGVEQKTMTDQPAPPAP